MNNKEVIKVLQKRLNENAYYNRLTACKITSPYYKHNVLKYRLALLYAIKVVRDADNAADVLYICDHEACKRGITYGADACDPCGHTRNIRHAANFEPFIDNYGRILAYVEHAQKENPQGDLISHEVLNDIWDLYKQYQPRLATNVYEFGMALKDIIDNAPTVEQNWKFYYDHGYEQAKRDLKRTQGKWIFEKANNEQTDGYICSICGRSFHTKVPYFSEYNYCPICGAKLKGGAE